jgi:Fe-S cluster assembly protein SufD
VASLRDRLAGDGTGLEAQLVRLASERPHAFADLNTAFFAEGAVVEVRPGAVLPAPIHLLFLASGETAPVMALPRTVVLCGPGSEADLVETFAGPGGLTCPVTGVQVGENASLRRYRLQDEADSAFHVSALFARLERNARFSDLSLSLGATLARHDLHVSFAGEGGTAALDGLFFADGERTSDTHTLIDHAAPHCTSRELYKGVVADKGIGVFRGRVVVRKGAQKTDAAQASRNLLLSREALVHSIPQLEILADDVKCRHGATSGQLDEAALFYLRSRGLSEPAARGLLTVAFAAELLQRIPAPALRERFAASLRRRLPGAAEFREAVL